MVFWINDHNIEWIIWFSKILLIMYGQKTAFLLIFCEIEMELFQVEMEIYHLKMHFKMVRHQMSHCYLSSKSKNNMRKWYFESFIADNFWSFNKKDPVCRILPQNRKSCKNDMSNEELYQVFFVLISFPLHNIYLKDGTQVTRLALLLK